MMNKQFEEWLLTKDGYPYKEDFDKLPQAFQWGVYLEFFDNVGIYLATDVAWFNKNDKFCLYHFWIEYENGDGYYESDLENMCNTRAEAQQEAVNKAFQILEQ